MKWLFYSSKLSVTFSLYNIIYTILTLWLKWLRKWWALQILVVAPSWWPCRVWGCELWPPGPAPAVIIPLGSPGSQFLSGARTGDTWTPGSGLTPVTITRDNVLLSRIYGEKIWAGPRPPVSPCHRQSVNWVLGSEEQNLFYPPGRQCQCFHLDLSPQRDHLTHHFRS